MDPTLAAAIEPHRGFLLRLARLELRDDSLAEDVVQETLIAALGAPPFAGASKLRTWLVGILKHKIVDALRAKQRRGRLIDEAASAALADAADAFETPFAGDGEWAAPPADWGDPETALAQRQFLEVLDACVDQLAPQQARVFVMKEYLELESTEICRELGLTTSNLHVTLFRARVSLRACLEHRWFDGAGRDAR